MMQLSTHFYKPAVMKYFICVFITLISTFSFSASYVNHQLNQQALVITTTEGTITLTALTHQSIEAFYNIADHKQLPSYAIAPQKINNTRVKIKTTEKTVEFSAGKIKVVIQKSPLVLSYFSHGRHLLSEEQGYFKKQSTVVESEVEITSTITDEVNHNIKTGEETHFGFRFFLNEDEKLLGGGERVLGMDRRGHRFPLYNKAHYGYST